MITRESNGTTTFTGDGVEVYKVLTLRRGLILKIDTGMELTRISSLSVARRDGYTVKRTNRGALKDVNRWLVERGGSAVWSKAYPNG